MDLHPPVSGPAAAGQGQQPNPQALAERLSRSLYQAQTYAEKLDRNQKTLNLGGILTSAGTTALTGWTSLAGPVFGDSVAAWRLTCIIAALLGFLTTVFMTSTQQLRYNERLAQANECIGRLKAVEFGLTAGSVSFAELWQEYAQILRQYPQELRESRTPR